MLKAIAAVTVLVIVLTTISCGGGSRIISGRIAFNPNTNSDTHETPAQSVGGLTGKSLGDALADIERYPAPGNVDKATFELLREELKRQLGERGISRFTSAIGAVSGRVEALATVGNSGGAQILWEAHLTGDTNNDGEVSIADITPIALRYLKRADDGSEDGYDAPCDADRDGEIGIADITPIALHYLERVDGYNVYRRDTPTGTPTLVGSTGFKTASGLSGARSASAAGTIDIYGFVKRPSVYVLTDPAGAAVAGYYEVRPVSGTDEALDGNENLLLYAPDNLLSPPNVDPLNVMQSDRDDEVGLLKDEIVVNFTASATLDQMINAVYSTGIGAHIAGKLSEGNGLQLRTMTDVSLMSNDRTALESVTGVDAAENNYLLAAPSAGKTASFANPEPDAALQWNLDTINAQEAWDYGKGAGQAVGGAGALIAFIDTGINAASSEFAGKVDSASTYIDGKPRMAGDPDLTGNIADAYGQGTAAASIAAAAQDGTGMSGVAFAADILVIKVGFLSENGSWYMPSSSLAEAVYYAVARNATVIHISNAVTSNPGEAVHRAIQFALLRNIPVVCPAGDYAGNVDQYYPAGYEESLTVGATDSLNNKASFTNSGTHVSVAAPGELVYGADAAGLYTTFSGTSFASAQVAGAVAMIRAVNPTLAPSAVQDLVRTHVTPLPPMLGLGTGILNLGETMANVPDAKRALTPPGPIIVTQIGGILTLDWPDAIEPEVEGYIVYRDIVSGFVPSPATEIATLVGRTSSQISSDEGNLVKGRTYYFLVVSYGQSNQSLPSQEVSATPWPQLTGLTVVPNGPGAISISWIDVLAGEPLLWGYNVYYNSANDFGTAVLAPGSPFTVATATMSGLSDGVEYWVWITMLGEGTNESPPFGPGNIVVAAPPAPANVVATDGLYSDYCEVAWTFADSATGYNVYRADDDQGAGELMLGQLSGQMNTSYRDFTGDINVHYWYRVASVNAFGVGPLSAYDQGWRELPPPSGVAATDGIYSSKVRISWMAEPAADDYEVWRGDAQGGPYSKIAATTGGATRWDDTTGTWKIHYWYAVKSKQGTAVSNMSADDEGWSIGWVITTVDGGAGGKGWTTSIALDSNDRAHISYYDYVNLDLEYAYWNGASWDITTVDSSGDVGYTTSIALDSNDRPHISYYDNTNYDLKYAYFNGSSWNISTPDSAGNVGAYSSIALDAADHPHVSCYDQTNGDLKYAYYNGASWVIAAIDSAGDVGMFTSLALDSVDNAHISYYDNSNDDLKYAYWNGASWDIATVDSAGDVGYCSSIALDSLDGPHISYGDNTNLYLKCANWNGSSWDIEIVDSGILTWYATSIALDSLDRPHVSYHDWTNLDLRYAQYNGSSWDVATVDSADDVGWYSSIALDSNDRPHISYSDSTNGALKYAWIE